MVKLVATIGERAALRHTNEFLFIHVRTTPLRAVSTLPYNPALGVTKSVWTSLPQDVQGVVLHASSQRATLARVVALTTLQELAVREPAVGQEIDVLHANEAGILQLGTITRPAISSTFTSSPKGMFKAE
ncbi:MAG: hypothetical protein EOO65_01540 [Methanosarcinales archaeon]|nr:MAG: hypothetical protein EOO65_01540 [Methanosarcinales archaeon]